MPNQLQLSVKDALDLSFLTRDQAITVIIRLQEERDMLRDLCERALIALHEDDFPQLRQDLRDGLDKSIQVPTDHPCARTKDPAV